MAVGYGREMKDGACVAIFDRALKMRMSAFVNFR